MQIPVSYFATNLFNSHIDDFDRLTFLDSIDLVFQTFRIIQFIVLDSWYLESGVGRPNHQDGLKFEINKYMIEVIFLDIDSKSR